MSVVLRFRSEGPAYERAQAVADAMELSIEDYLLACVAEGHQVLRARRLELDTDRERNVSTIMRRADLRFRLG